MALEAALFSEGLLGGRPMAAPGGIGGWSWSAGATGASDGGAMAEMMMGLEGASAAAYWDAAGASSSVLMQGADRPDGSSAAPPPMENGGGGGNAAAVTDIIVQEGALTTEMSAAPAGRRKPRRTRSAKNREEAESQRMTHIAVERNRRKQMNEYLAVLRSIMPPSYVQRGDQASIIGGAINYVKEMEQLLQSLEARKHARHSTSPGAASAPSPFAGFFTFPQYSMSAGARSPATANCYAPPPADDDDNGNADADADGGADADDDAANAGSRPSAVADVEVTMVESHASLRLLSRRRPRQLLRLVAGLQAHRLAVLHLNVTSAAGGGETGLYSLSLKVEDDCALSSVDEIAAAVHRIVEEVEQEAAAGGCSGELRQRQTEE